MKQGAVPLYRTGTAPFLDSFMKMEIRFIYNNE